MTAEKEAKMTDLEVCRLCAEAMGWRTKIETHCNETRVYRQRVASPKSDWQEYDPLHDPAQNFALDKVLLAHRHYETAPSLFRFWEYSEGWPLFEREGNMLDPAVLMRARAECVAWMVKNKEGR